MDQPKTDQEDQLNLKAVLVTKKKLCFICNNLHVSDDNEYKHGGLGRGTEERATKKLFDQIKNQDKL